VLQGCLARANDRQGRSGQLFDVGCAGFFYFSGNGARERATSKRQVMAESKYVAIARKWRPQTFNEIVGQDHITRTLTNAIKNGRIHHAFLFIGSRGIGKTTTARILAKALNCASVPGPTVEPCNACDNCLSISAGNNIDVLEIDGASNNGVDDVRSIRENVRMVPTSGRYKIYIIDEVHQLSGPAFNALLKTLEEPPPHAVFIMATTEAHKIPATIISRCQRYDFRRVVVSDIVTLLKKILAKEKLKATDEALYAIARVAEGGVRDAQSILDELITYCDKEITFNDVFEVLGLVNWQCFHDLCDAMLAGNVARQLEIIEEVIAAGKDLSQFVEDILRYYRNLLVCLTVGTSELLLRLPETEMSEMKKRAKQFTVVKLIKLVERFSELVNAYDSQIAQRTALETLLIQLTRVDVDISLDTVMEKLVLLGKGGIASAGGGAVESDTPPNPPEAGPPPDAPAVPANEEKRAIVLGKGADASWRELLRRAGKSAGGLALHLGRSRPVGVDADAVLTLEFEPGAEKARSFFQGETSLKKLEKFLQAETANVRSVYFVTPSQGEPEEESGTPENGAYAAADPPQDMDYSRVMEEPGIAAVLDEFKGEIVEIRDIADNPV